jgi:transcriptional regulator with XRE-family HTH domain
MKRDKEEFAGTMAALGPRLRELRRRAGLTQTELAIRMDHPTAGARCYLVQVEHGRRPGLTVASLGGYLRACRAGFIDVLDVLERYTRMAPIAEVRAERAIAELESRLVGQVRITRPPMDADERSNHKDTKALRERREEC